MRSKNFPVWKALYPETDPHLRQERFWTDLVVDWLLNSGLVFFVLICFAYLRLNSLQNHFAATTPEFKCKSVSPGLQTDWQTLFFLISTEACVPLLQNIYDFLDSFGPDVSSNSIIHLNLLIILVQFAPDDVCVNHFYDQVLVIKGNSVL